MTTDADVLYCQRHPNVETGLRCGRCETPICPKCAVFTDVGARCPDCAPARKLPQFEVSPLIGARALAAAVVSGLVIGALWGVAAPDWAGLFGIFIGVGIGWAISESISVSSNRKSGPIVQAMAVLGVGIAYLARNLAWGEGLFPSDDIWGLIVVGVAAVFAVGRLRF